MGLFGRGSSAKETIGGNNNNNNHNNNEYHSLKREDVIDSLTRIREKNSSSPLTVPRNRSSGSSHTSSTIGRTAAFTVVSKPKVSGRTKKRSSSMAPPSSLRPPKFSAVLSSANTKRSEMKKQSRVAPRKQQASIEEQRRRSLSPVAQRPTTTQNANGFRARLMRSLSPPRSSPTAPTEITKRKKTNKKRAMEAKLRRKQMDGLRELRQSYSSSSSSSYEEDDSQIRRSRSRSPSRSPSRRSPSRSPSRSRSPPRRQSRPRGRIKSKQRRQGRSRRRSRSPESARSSSSWSLSPEPRSIDEPDRPFIFQQAAEKVARIVMAVATGVDLTMKDLGANCHADQSFLGPIPQGPRQKQIMRRRLPQLEPIHPGMKVVNRVSMGGAREASLLSYASSGEVEVDYTDEETYPTDDPYADDDDDDDDDFVNQPQEVDQSSIICRGEDEDLAEEEAIKMSAPPSARRKWFKKGGGGNASSSRRVAKKKSKSSTSTFEKVALEKPPPASEKSFPSSTQHGPRDESDNEEPYSCDDEVAAVSSSKSKRRRARRAKPDDTHRYATVVREAPLDDTPRVSIPAILPTVSKIQRPPHLSPSLAPAEPGDEDPSVEYRLAMNGTKINTAFKQAFLDPVPLPTVKRDVNFVEGLLLAFGMDEDDKLFEALGTCNLAPVFACVAPDPEEDGPPPTMEEIRGWNKKKKETSALDEERDEADVSDGGADNAARNTSRTSSSERKTPPQEQHEQPWFMIVMDRLLSPFLSPEAAPSQGHLMPPQNIATKSTDLDETPYQSTLLEAFSDVETLDGSVTREELLSGGSSAGDSTSMEDVDVDYANANPKEILEELEQVEALDESMTRQEILPKKRQIVSPADLRQNVGPTRGNSKNRANEDMKKEKATLGSRRSTFRLFPEVRGDMVVGEPRTTATRTQEDEIRDEAPDHQDHDAPASPPGGFELVSLVASTEQQQKDYDTHMMMMTTTTTSTDAEKKDLRQVTFSDRVKVRPVPNQQKKAKANTNKKGKANTNKSSLSAAKQQSEGQQVTGTTKPIGKGLKSFWGGKKRNQSSNTKQATANTTPPVTNGATQVERNNNMTAAE